MRRIISIIVIALLLFSCKTKKVEQIYKIDPKLGFALVKGEQDLSLKILKDFERVLRPNLQEEYLLLLSSKNKLDCMCVCDVKVLMSEKSSAWEKDEAIYNLVHRYMSSKKYLKALSYLNLSLDIEHEGECALAFSNRYYDIAMNKIRCYQSLGFDYLAMQSLLPQVVSDLSVLGGREGVDMSIKLLLKHHRVGELKQELEKCKRIVYQLEEYPYYYIKFMGVYIPLSISYLERDEMKGQFERLDSTLFFQCIRDLK